MPKGCASSVILCMVGKNMPPSVPTMTNMITPEVFVMVVTAVGIMSMCEGKRIIKDRNEKEALLKILLVHKDFSSSQNKLQIKHI